LGKNFDNVNVYYYICKMEKVCKTCGVNKPIEEFSVRKEYKDGRRNECIICYREKRKKYNGRYKDRVSDWYFNNKELTVQRTKEWKENNYERNRLLNRKSEKKRRSDITKKNKERYHSNSLFRLRMAIPPLIRNSLNKKGFSKKSLTSEILGIDYEGFYKHIENQFTNGMTWDNRGSWELDHKIPVSLGKTEEEIIKLNHYTNFQPLWKKDNIVKSDKVLPEFEYLVKEYIQ